jgi:hypothetical protein
MLEDHYSNLGPALALLPAAVWVSAQPVVSGARISLKIQ